LNFLLINEFSYFLDRDGVLIRTLTCGHNPGDIRILVGIPQALSLKEAGYQLIVIGNQTVNARRLVTEQQVCMIQSEVERTLEQGEALRLDGCYFYPHHPNATLANYQVA